jgi:hypothetical protein
MFGKIGELLARLKTSEASKDGSPEMDPSKSAAKDANREVERSGSAAPKDDAVESESATNAPVMFEILKLLSRIEYGMDVEQIATALAISPTAVRANCDALEQEMFVHHHGPLEEWFIGQRGLEFLRLNGSVE